MANINDARVLIIATDGVEQAGLLFILIGSWRWLAQRLRPNRTRSRSFAASSVRFCFAGRLRPARLM